VNEFAGTGALVRLGLRRDRVLLPRWALLFSLTAAFSASATVDLYPSVVSRVAAAEAINGSPSLVALYGRVYDPTSLGAIALIKMGGIGAALLAVLAFMLVVRHTRAEEESGRLELVAAGVVGRLAPLAAALVVSTATMLAIGVLTAGSLVAGGLPAPGSVAFGLAWAATGTAFAAVGGLTAQLAVGARAANGLAACVLAGAYLLRAVGDIGARAPSWPTWLSPVGWGQQVRPFAGDRWLVLVLLVAFAVVVAGAAFAVVRARDLGAGLLPDRPGPASAGPALGTAVGLAWRLHRGSLLAWTAGFAFMGLLLGSIASDVGSFFESSSGARQMIETLGGTSGLVDAFLAAEMGFAGIFASAYGVQAAMRLHAEESALRAEPVLATQVGRAEWVLSHVAVAVAGTTVLLSAVGLAVGVAHAASVGDPSEIGRVVVAALVHLPAAWVLTAIVVAAFGVAPRLVGLGWAALVVFLLVGELGPLFSAPQWALDLTPFAHVPRLPGGDLTAVPLLWLTAIAVGLALVGLAGFRRRDVG
jgi:ABC-2 type transport system permease protein